VLLPPRQVPNAIDGAKKLPDAVLMATPDELVATYGFCIQDLSMRKSKHLLKPVVEGLFTQ